jgi:class 3 adenylate cyclase
MGDTRKLAAILISDVVGYSRLAGADEDRILARLRALRSDLIDPIISVHHGRIVKRTGDGSNHRVSQCSRRGALRNRSADLHGRAQRRTAAGKAHRVSHRHPSR